MGLLIQATQDYILLGIKKNWEEAIFERLDRALANYQWIKLCHSAIIQNFVIFGLNHASILLNTWYSRWHAKCVHLKIKAKWHLSDKFIIQLKIFDHLIYRIPGVSIGTEPTFSNELSGMGKTYSSNTDTKINKLNNNQKIVNLNK